MAERRPSARVRASDLDAVIVDASTAGVATDGLNRGSQTATRVPPSEVRVKDDEDDEEVTITDSKHDLEAMLEARQWRQLELARRIFVKIVTLVCLAGGVFLAVRSDSISYRVGEAEPWRWSFMLAIFFGSRFLCNRALDLVMWLLDAKHVVLKRVSFLLGGIFDDLAFTLYCIILSISWDALLAAPARRGDDDWERYHRTVSRVANSLIAWGVVHTISKGIARYMEVYFQREAYFAPIMRALAEEFVMVTLLALCSVDMRQWLEAHGDDASEWTPSPDARSASRREGGGEDFAFAAATWRKASDQAKKVQGILRHFVEVNTRGMKDPLSLGAFVGLAKEHLPIKMDMITAREGTVQPSDLSLARLHKMGAHVRKKKLHLPEKFRRNANKAFIRGRVPLIDDKDIVHTAVASAVALRMCAVMRQLQGARRFVPLDGVFFDRMGLPKEVQEKIMEVMDTEKTGALRREQIVKRFVEMYERRRDLALSLASTTSVLATLERITLSALYVVLLFVVLGIFDQNILEAWFTVSSMFLAFVFMFGNSIKVLFESVIFIFVVHPFDVGDSVLINDDRHKIVKISILTTVTEKWNGQVIYYPNSVLNGKPLINLTRTKHFTDEQSWVVNIDIPENLFHTLKLYVDAFVREHHEDFKEITPRLYSHPTDPMKLKITLYYEYTFNGLPPARSGGARDKLGLAMRKFFVDNAVPYRQNALPVEMFGGAGGYGHAPAGGDITPSPASRPASVSKQGTATAAAITAATMPSPASAKPAASVFLDLAVGSGAVAADAAPRLRRESTGGDPPGGTHSRSNSVG